MITRISLSRILIIVGSIAMLFGTLDPLEGSAVILGGSGLVLLGTRLSNGQRHIFRYWLWVFILIALGFAMLVILSMLGGIGGSAGRSLWWGLFILPYPIGWIMGMISLIVRLVKFIRADKQSGL